MLSPLENFLPYSVFEYIFCLVFGFSPSDMSITLVLNHLYVFSIYALLF